MASKNIWGVGTTTRIAAPMLQSPTSLRALQRSKACTARWSFSKMHPVSLGKIISGQPMPFSRTLLALALTAINSPAGQSAKPVAHGYPLTGAVVNALTGAPVPGVEVSLLCDYQLHRNQSLYCDYQFHAHVRTGPTGQFAVSGLKSGIYFIGAKHPGFEPSSEFWQDNPDVIRAQINFAPARARVKLTPMSLVYGRVTDTSGKPVTGVLVQAMRPRESHGLPVQFVAGWATTDNEGKYRIENLTQGPAFVRAAGKLDPWPAKGSAEGFLPVYYPGVPDRERATLFQCSPARGTEANLQVRLQPAHRIRGQLRGPLPAKTPHFVLMRGTEMADHDAARLHYDPASGSIELRGVIGGSYRLEVVEEIGGKMIGGQVPVNVSDQDVEKVVVGFEQPFDVPCQIISGAAALRSDPRARIPLPALLLLQPVSWGVTPIFQADLLPDGSCVFRNVLLGSYRIAPQWGSVALSSIKVGDTDVTASGMVTLHADKKPPRITVTVR